MELRWLETETEWHETIDGVDVAYVNKEAVLQYKKTPIYDGEGEDEWIDVPTVYSDEEK